ncbi:MAG: hypothetical protein F6K09_08070 [Merismopedia sp. SIO2A8]|nr:hypothetical protein [Merismopedia sp. SIO2A8]
MLIDSIPFNVSTTVSLRGGRWGGGAIAHLIAITPFPLYESDSNPSLTHTKSPSLPVQRDDWTEGGRWPLNGLE